MNLSYDEIKDRIMVRFGLKTLTWRRSLPILTFLNGSFLQTIRHLFGFLFEAVKGAPVFGHSFLRW